MFVENGIETIVFQYIVMKKIIIVFFLFSSLISNRAFSQDAVVDINTFHSALDPYGRWIDDPQYGTVWISNEPGFRPYYTNGHWVYTDEGWAWVSDYSWGWAPFHYGPLGIYEWRLGLGSRV